MTDSGERVLYTPVSVRPARVINDSYSACRKVKMGYSTKKENALLGYALPRCKSPLCVPQGYAQPMRPAQSRRERMGARGAPV
jgi:hypothetical protein